MRTVEERQIDEYKAERLESLVMLTGQISKAEMCCGFYVINRVFNAASRGVDEVTITYGELADYSEKFMRKSGRDRLTNLEIENALGYLNRLEICPVGMWVEKCEFNNGQSVVMLNVHRYLG